MFADNWNDGYENVWLGVSGETVKTTLIRLGILDSIPAKIKFLSAEPLLEPIHTKQIADLIKCINWVIIGGESGNNHGEWRYRPTQPAWIKDVIRISKERNVPVFVKQLGTYLARVYKLKDFQGGDINEWPEDFKVRQMPKVKEVNHG